MTNIITVAENIIDNIAQTIDQQLGDELDATLESSGILIINTQDDKQFVININSIYNQIWVSSPVSGGAHFAYENGIWQSIRGKKIDLYSLLSHDIFSITGKKINFKG